MSLRIHNGMSLIEVLVAMVVLSIGLLGVAALFVSSLQFGGGAILRTRAIGFAEDMADRIRANALAGAAYEVDADGSGTDNECAETATLAVAASCTPAELAAHDIFSWKGLLASSSSGLPDGEATIDHDASTTPPTYTIVVRWSERDDTSSYTLVFRTP